MSILWAYILFIHMCSVIYTAWSFTRLVKHINRYPLKENRHTLLFGFISLKHVLIAHIVFVAGFIVGSIIFISTFVSA